MNILVVGSGGREHAVIKALKNNKKITKIYCAPGNGGISKDACCVPIPATEIEKMVSFSKENKIDFCVVTPDDPLVLGMVDALEKVGVACFGPNKIAAELEGSKVFSKNLMEKYNIPTAKHAVFKTSNEAIAYIKTQNSFPTVIKADGLAMGKGVIIAENEKEAIEGVNSIMEDKIFGESGNNIVIEEFLTGPEISVLAFCDSKTILPMVSAMDHKRALDNDMGLNTGGMGTIAPSPYFTKEIEKTCMETIFKPTMEAMNSEGRPFKGCIFFGLMLTKDGVKVIEYNCRFGDPEAQVVLSLLQTDLFDIMQACRNEKLDEIKLSFKEEAAACVMMASGGYPQKYETGKKISGLNKDGQLEEAIIYHSGTKLLNDEFLTAGGRVLGITAFGKTLQEALDNAYGGVAKINFDKAHFRKDIGKKAL